PVQNMAERQKWAILSVALAEHNDLMCLKDENPLYKEAERYAEPIIRINPHPSLNIPNRKIFVLSANTL
ncbi:MAG: hypothetical protein WAP31_05080, partial [Candidatus Methanoculleus thermohydrogenotrophicum]